LSFSRVRQTQPATLLFKALAFQSGRSKNLAQSPREQSVLALRMKPAGPGEELGDPGESGGSEFFLDKTNVVIPE
jgi:hypothetical protein